ncbi:MAG: DotU family type VI secretion system protein [Burkholderiaceae bacterium]|jgi:type VI secretion system protein ImpK|nr:DotU family type VI secretion system protein [Burkholderiaceae bacterium]
MSAPDPFAAFEPERTIIKPRPRAPGAAARSAGPQPHASADAMPADIGEIALLNPLVSCASPLLLLSVQLRRLTQPPDASALRASAVEAVQQFDAAARRAGIGSETVAAARYVLCTALDEAVANTPWGVAAGWNAKTLLVQFHNETWGGEKLFQLLGRLAQTPSAHRPLLELIYCVLALGFEGRYRITDNGRTQLDGVRARLAELIRKDRPPLEPQLSPHWRGERPGAARLRDTLPLWVLAVAFALLLALSWGGLRLWLNHRSDAVYSAIAGLRVPSAPPPPVPPPPPPPPTPRLARFLEPEIKEGLVTVTDEADRSTVRLRGDSFFASGSAEPTAASLPVLRRIGEALAQVPGEVLITGHSDNQPIRSLRYPSNWHLSNARAQAVMGALAAQVAPARMHADGKADAEPVAPNDTPADRARNRRVEVVLMTGGGK